MGVKIGSTAGYMYMDMWVGACQHHPVGDIQLLPTVS